MPFIETKASLEISRDAETEMRKRLSEAIEIFGGKSEKWLMLEFSGGRRLSFRGASEPDSAIVSVHLLGTASDAEYDSFTKAVTDIVSATLGISPERIYVKYSEYKHWGFAGENF